MTKYEIRRSRETNCLSHQDLRYVDVLRGFGEQTTGHGIPRIQTSRGILKTALWSSISVCLFGAMLWHLSEIFTQYFDHPIHVHIELKPTKQLVFPAVTICNMNPMKKSAIAGGNPELSKLLTGGSGANSSEKRTRRKRSLNSTCTDPSQIHAPSGLCFGLGSLSNVNFGGARRLCRQLNGGIAMINTLEKWEFIKNSSIFEGVSGDYYFIGIKYSSWDYVLPVDDSLFNAYLPGEPSSGVGHCVSANRSNNHGWSRGKCGFTYPIDKKLALCQQLVQCPWPIYYDAFDNQYVCYFLFDNHHTMRHREAINICARYDKDVTLAVMDNQAKVNHVIYSGVLNSSSSNDYWIYLEKPDSTSVTTPWFTSPEPITEVCQMGHVDQGTAHRSTNHSCDGPALALCEWRTEGPTSPPTTVTPTTIQATTDSPTTVTPTTIQATTDSPTTVTPITIKATTVTPTTIKATTDSPTTVTPTTIKATTDSPTTVTPTTIQSSPTSDLQSTKLQTTDPSTYYPQSTYRQSTDHSTFYTTTTAAPSSTSNPPTTPAPLPPTTTPPPGAIAPPPISINGSKYPERIQIRQELQKQEKAFELVAEMPEEEKAAMGYKSEEFLIDCQYNGYGCDPTGDFDRFYSVIHGNCYVFNSGWNYTGPLVTSDKTGPRYGLQVLINIGQDEYTENFGEEAGARIIIHPQNSMPFPEDEGILAKPGLLTSIGVKKVTVSRLPLPYGTGCVKNDPGNIDLTRNVFEELYPVNYSMLACQKTCYQSYVINECGCADPYYPKEGEAFPYPPVSSCDPNNIIQDDCKYDVNRRYMANQLQCECPGRCVDDFFTPEMSTARWPSEIQLNKIKQRFGDSLPELFYDASDPRKYSRNLLKLEIYYKDLNYEKISERPSYNGFRFVSNIGGVIGLWMGFSLMTAFELIEFLLDLIVLTWNKRRRANNQMDTGYIMSNPAPQHDSSNHVLSDKDIELETNSRFESSPSQPPSYSVTPTRIGSTMDDCMTPVGGE